MSKYSRVTGGKVKSSKTRPVANRAATALRMAAQTLCRSHSALGAYYRLMQSRMGAPKAFSRYRTQAGTHFLSPLDIWRLRGAQTPLAYRYTDPGIDAYEQSVRDRILKNLKIKAQAFGLELIPISTPTECVS